MTVSDMIMTARTAAARTGSGILRRTAGSSTHSCRGIFTPPVGAVVAAAAADAVPRRSSVSKDLQLPTTVRLTGGCPVCSRSTRAESVTLPRTPVMISAPYIWTNADARRFPPNVLNQPWKVT
ncbi:hypothetical protein GCM10010518_59960 [Kitasatospora cinereorecta]